MSSEEQERNDVLEWKKRKNPILVNLRSAIGARETAFDEISSSHRNLDSASDLLRNQILQLHRIESIYRNNKAYPPYNPIAYGSIDIMTSLTASDASNAAGLALNAKAIRTNVDSFLGTVIASGATGSSIAITTLSLADKMKNKETILADIQAIGKPTAHDRRIELSPKLSAIDTRLSTKLDGSWQTLNDQSKKDRFLQAASSARDLISDLLHILAPDNDVKAMDWFEKETKNDKPTQRQRAKFAILGRNKTIEDPALQAIYDLADNIRDSYKKLNSIAHLRDYERDLQTFTETLIDQCQIYLLQLLELRSMYFQP